MQWKHQLSVYAEAILDITNYHMVHSFLGYKLHSEKQNLNDRSIALRPNHGLKRNGCKSVGLNPNHQHRPFNIQYNISWNIHENDLGSKRKKLTDVWQQTNCILQVWKHKHHFSWKLDQEWDLKFNFLVGSRVLHVWIRSAILILI